MLGLTVAGSALAAAGTDGPNGRDFNLVMNHELRGAQGVAARPRVNGAFDSVWRIDSKTLEVEPGADLIDPGIRYFDYATHSYAGAPTARSRHS